MKATGYRIVFGAVLTALPVLAQSADKVQDKMMFFDRQATEPGGTQQVTVRFVGSAMALESDVVKGQPYSADAVSETIQTLANGNRIVRKNTSRIYRDGDGRTRREETMSGVGPWATSGGSKQFVSIRDPNTKTVYQLDPETRVARKIGVRVHAMATPTTMAPGKRLEKQPMPMLAAPVPDGVTTITGDVMYHGADANDSKTENLGTQMMEGVSVKGTRTTTTIPAGAIGNEQPIETVTERWYSDDLKTVVLSKTSDPRFGDTTYRLSNIHRSEPPAYLFQVPSDYKLEEEPAPGSGPQVMKWVEK